MPADKVIIRFDAGKAAGRATGNTTGNFAFHKDR